MLDLILLNNFQNDCLRTFFLNCVIVNPDFIIYRYANDPQVHLCGGGLRLSLNASSQIALHVH